jgi:gliding motility-associated-like protein
MSEELKAQCGSCEYSVQLIQNGNFTGGNNSFTTDLNLGSGFFCPLCPEGTYAIGAAAILYHSDFTGSDHTNPPFGNFLIANGQGQAGVEVWCQTVNVVPNTDYQFSFWAQDITNNNDVHPLALLQVSFNGVLNPDILTADAGWSEQTFSWNSGNLTSVEICIVNQQNQTGGNDFGIDDISMTSCYSYELSQQAVAGSDETICSGETITLGQSSVSGYSYSWNNPDGLSSTAVSDPTVTLFNTGNFNTVYSYILTTDSAGVGCVTTDQVNITVIPVPSFDLGPDQILCEGESVILNAGDTWQSVAWSNGDDTETILVDEQGTYTATVQYGFCTATDDVFVDVVIFPPVDIGPDLELCEGETATLDATYTGLWSTGEMSSTLLVDEPGTYIFTLEESGCSTTDTMEVVYFDYPTNVLPETALLCENGETILTSNMSGLWSTGEIAQEIVVDEPGYYHIEMNNGPCVATYGTDVYQVLLPQLDIGTDISICVGEPVNLDAFEEQNSSYIWNTGDTTAVLSVDTTGTYIVSVSNECGSAADTIDVFFEWCGWGIFIPSAFTNNFDGINDSWQVKGYNLAGVKIRIYNRVGNLIYYSENIDESWSPSFDLVGDDAYNYHIQAFNTSGEMKEYVGHLMLLR